MADPAETPIIVNPSPAADQITSAFRVLVVLIGGGSAVLGFLEKRDVAGLVAFLQSEAFLPILGALGALLAFVWGQWKTITRKRQMVTVTHAAPDSVAMVAAPAAEGERR